MSTRVKRLLVLIPLLFLSGLFLPHRQTLSSHFQPQKQWVNKHIPSINDYDSTTVSTQQVEDWDSSKVLRGAPTRYFRDNLRNDTRYLTTCVSEGFTNQFLGHINMIYLAILSGRVPIIPPFDPGRHNSRRAGALPFGQVFNLTLLRNNLRRPILEWSDVKDIPSLTSFENPPDSEREQLGCWSTRKEAEPTPLRSPSQLNLLRLDTSYTRVPTTARLNPNDVQDMTVVFSKLVPYIFPHNPLRDRFEFMSPSPMGHRLPPDEQLVCFDRLYYVTSSHKLYDWETSWSPPWNSIGANLRFTDELVKITKGYLSRVFNIGEGEIPPFIAIHDRRGDFAEECDNPKAGCLNPLSTFAEKVEVIRKTLLEKHDMNVTHVILASNEQDPTFWSKVRAHGWFYFNHTEERTQETLGEWYLPLLDIVSQSLASGFVGTEHSTFSLISARRVQDWNNRPTFIVPRVFGVKD